MKVTFITSLVAALATVASAAPADQSVNEAAKLPQFVEFLGRRCNGPHNPASQQRARPGECIRVSARTSSVFTDFDPAWKVRMFASRDCLGPPLDRARLTTPCLELQEGPFTQVRSLLFDVGGRGPGGPPGRGPPGRGPPGRGW